MSMASVTASVLQSLETILHDMEDEDADFFGILLPALIDEYKKLSRKRKRVMLCLKERKGRGGKKGRSWTQRKKGDMRPQDFAWFKLCHHPDVADLTSVIGKVNTVTDVLSLK